MSDSEVKLKLTGDSSGAEKALKQVGDEAEKSSGKLAGMGKVVGGILTADVLKKAASAAVDFGQDSIAAFAEAEAAQAKLDDAFSRFPALAGANADALRTLNAEIQRKTGYDGDDLAAAQAQLAQYGLNEQQLREMTPLLVDYAAKTGKDMKTASEDLGKAMLGSGKALKSIGIDFQDAGSVAGNFDQVMSGLTGQVQGFAENGVPQAQKQAAILKAQFGDIQEAVGEKLLPVLIQLGEAGIAALDWAGENEGAVNAIGVALGVVGAAWVASQVAAQASAIAQGVAHAQTVAGWVKQGAAAVASAAVVVAGWVAAQASAVASGAAQFAANARAAAGWVLSQGAMIAASVAQKAVTAAQWLMNAAMSANPIGLVVLAIAALAAGLIYAYQHSETFRNVVDGAFKAIAAAGTWLWNTILQPVITAIIGGFAMVARGVANFLDALSKIPGFGWAADAASKMRGAADAADRLASSITKIPPTKDVSIRVMTSYTQTGTPPSAGGNLLVGPKATYASGGRPRIGELALFGEEGPELWVPDTSGTVLTAAQTKQALAGPAALTGGGAQPLLANLYDADGTLMARMQGTVARQESKWVSMALGGVR